MAKQDALDAINATIVENNQKGITAPSLKNVLITMVENAGEGGSSGEGALRIIVPELMMIGPEIIAMGELSPTTWGEIKAAFETEEGGFMDIMSEYDVVVNMSFAHNASVAQQILDKARAGQGVSVVLDSTPYTSALYAIMNAQMPGMIEESIMGGVQPAAHIVQYMKPTPAASGELAEGFLCILIPASSISMPDIGAENYPSDMRITLNLDGSLIFEKPEADPEA